MTHFGTSRVAHRLRPELSIVPETDSGRQLGSAAMGAPPEQDLAINFLAALNNIWSEHSGTVQLTETAELLPTLAQITIRWLAATAREQAGRGRRPELDVKGNVRWGASEVQPSDAFRDSRPDVPLREALSRIVHSEPEWMSVQDEEVLLCWKYTPRYDADPEKEPPYCAYFFASSLIEAIRRALYSEERRRGQVTELEQMLRTDRAYAGLLPPESDTP
jgi:hypothetical protein